MSQKKKTTVYSCSGCSNVAQLANRIAVKLDRDNEATMSCIAGVGGDVVSLVKQAKIAEEILVLDGCALAYASNCLKRHSIEADLHIILTDYELTKNYRSDFDDQEFHFAYEKVLKSLFDLHPEK